MYSLSYILLLWILAHGHDLELEFVDVAEANSDA